MSERVKKISLDNLRNSFVQPMVSMGDDLFYASGFVPNPEFPHFFHVPAPALTLLEKGRTSVRIDMHYFELEAPGLILTLPHQRLEIIEQSADITGKFLLFSQDFCHKLQVHDYLNLILSLTRHSTVALNEEDFVRARNYMETFFLLLQDNDKPFYEESLLHMARCLFFALGRYFYSDPGANASRYQLLSEKFVQLARQHSAHERRVAFYSSHLGVTPHHLSDLVRQATGQTAGWWITEFSILDAKVLLSSSKLSINEISEELRFGDAATFGKFFRRNTGLTPSEFRSKELDRQMRLEQMR